MARAAIFIDGGYLDVILRDAFGGASIDFSQFPQAIAHGHELLRTYYYHCPPYQGNPPTRDERERVARSQRFFDALSRLDRFQVRLGKLAKRGQDHHGNPIFMQKRVDILLGVDMVQLAATRQISTAILVAGDSDFMPAVEAVKPHGVSVILVHGPKTRDATNTVHQELWDCCDERHQFTQDLIDPIRRN